MPTATNFNNYVFVDARINTSLGDDDPGKINQTKLRLVVLLAICKELTQNNPINNRVNVLNFLKSFMNSYYNTDGDDNTWDKIQTDHAPSLGVTTDWNSWNDDNKKVAVLFGNGAAVTTGGDADSTFVAAEMKDSELIQYLVMHPGAPDTVSGDLSTRNEYLKNTLVKINLEQLMKNLKDQNESLVPNAASTMKGGGRKATSGSSSGASGHAKVKTSRPSSSPSPRASKSASATTLTSKSRSQAQTQAQTQRAQARPNSGSGLSSPASSSRTTRETEKKNGGGKRSSRVALPSSHSSPKITRNSCSRRS